MALSCIILWEHPENESVIADENSNHQREGGYRVGGPEVEVCNQQKSPGDGVINSLEQELMDLTGCREDKEPIVKHKRKVNPLTMTLTRSSVFKPIPR